MLMMIMMMTMVMMLMMMTMVVLMMTMVMNDGENGDSKLS